MENQLSQIRFVGGIKNGDVNFLARVKEWQKTKTKKTDEI